MIYPRGEVKRPPIHPGVILAQDVMPELRKERTIAEIAALLGISRQNLYRIMDGETAISPDVAVRLGKLCGNGASLWLGLQADYDEWEATQRLRKELERIPTIQ